jgi:glutaconate CoA-transferase subunit B
MKNLATKTPYNPAELTVVMGSRALQDGQIVFAGAGLPVLAVVLAQRTHAPSLAILFEVGGVAPRISILPRSTNEARAVRRSVATPPTIDMMLYLQRGFIDVGFLSGAQIDRHGNINSSYIGPVENPKIRLPGSGGANDIASSANQVFIISYHEKRRFVERVDYVTSPGFLEGGDAREKAGLVGGGARKVITNLGILEFDPKSREMKLVAVHPGITPEQVQDKTGFQLAVADDLEVTTPPSEEELEILRTIDPERKYLKEGEF